MEPYTAAVKNVLPPDISAKDIVVDMNCGEGKASAAFKYTVCIDINPDVARIAHKRLRLHDVVVAHNAYPPVRRADVVIADPPWSPHRSKNKRIFRGDPVNAYAQLKLIARRAEELGARYLIVHYKCELPALWPYLLAKSYKLSIFLRKFKRIVVSPWMLMIHKDFYTPW